MKAYELLFFVAPTIDEETRAGVMKRIDSTIAAGEGTVDNVDAWGRRKPWLRWRKWASVSWLMKSVV